jgi:hypothetical protein
VAADLALVTHAAQRHAHEVASRGFGDGPAKRGLTDTRRPDEAEDRPLHLAGAFLHGEIFEDPLFDLFEAVVLVVELVLGFDQIGLDVLARAPWQGDSSQSR